MTYRQRFIDATNDIIRRTKNGELTREERMTLAKVASDEYALQHSIENMKAQELENRRAEETKRKPRELPFNPPESDLIERLTDAILHEELSDPDVYKVAHNEYPFMSKSQFALRRDREYGEKLAENHGIDGKDHAKPTRRTRTKKENFLTDRFAKIRNKEIAKRYREFTEEQPVITTLMSSDEIEAYLNEKYTTEQRKYAGKPL